MLYNLIIATNILYETNRTNHGKKHSKRRKSDRPYDKRLHQAGDHSTLRVRNIY